MRLSSSQLGWEVSLCSCAALISCGSLSEKRFLFLEGVWLHLHQMLFLPPVLCSSHPPVVVQQVHLCILSPLERAMQQYRAIHLPLHTQSVLLLIPGRRAVGPRLPVFCPGFQQRPWQMSCSSDRGAEAGQSPHPLGSPLRRSSKAATYSTNYSLWKAVGHPACRDRGMSSGPELTNHSTDRLVALKAAELRLSQLWPQHRSTAARGTVFSQPCWKLTSISQGLVRR